MPQRTIMIRNCNRGPDPIRASMKPKTSKHTPKQNLTIFDVSIQLKEHKNISYNETTDSEVYLRAGGFSPLKYVKIRSKYLTYLCMTGRQKSQNIQGHAIPKIEHIANYTNNLTRKNKPFSIKTSFLVVVVHRFLSSRKELQT